MQINIDNMVQMIQEQSQILQMCAEHDGCINCPMKSSPIQMQTSVYTCEHTEVDNASKIQE